MELAVTVFQRRVGRSFEWTTIGLGQAEVQWHGVNLTKVEAGVVDLIRKRLRKALPRDLEPLEIVEGRRLEIVALDFASGGSPGGRRRVHGKFPLVVEPRPAGAAAAGTLTRAYHPLRPSEWFVVPPASTLAEAAVAYFKEPWQALDDEGIEELQSRSRDQLRIVALTIEDKRLASLLDDAKPDAPSLLGGGPRVTGLGLLSSLGVGETRRAASGRLPPGMPRRPLRDRIEQLVCGKRRASVLLVGPSGAGKSMLVRQLVHDLLAADGYATHRNLDRVHQVFRISGRRIIAGMSYLGQWEQRCVDVVEAARKHEAVLWIEDLPAWGRIGESTESDRSLATFFRGPAARGEITLVAECTQAQLRQLEDDAPGFAAAFTTLFVEPTDLAETMRMLVYEARALEVQNRVALDPRALRTVLELAGSLGTGTAFPGRALDLLRSLARGDTGPAVDLRTAEHQARHGQKIAAIKIYRKATGEGLRASKRAVELFIEEGRWPALGAEHDPGPPKVVSALSTGFGQDPATRVITPRGVVQQLARRTGMPEVLLTPDVALHADRVKDAFARQIMGQSAAIDAVSDLLLRIKAGLTDPSRPWGVLLFTGPTGTGKTEMAKCLAEYLYGGGARLVRFDMSEYGGADAPARLIGDRSNPEGTLTAGVRTQPFCVLLLDEVEKAHPSVLNLMLQLFDDGRLTDAAGNVVDFCHTVVVMTSNLGARAAPSVGFGGEAHATRAEVDAAVRDFFPPELFNRIDRVVHFSALSAEAARGIAVRELRSLLARRGLTERNVFVRFTEAVVDTVVERAFDARYGARSVKRWLEDRVGAWMADHISAQRSEGLRVLWLHRREEELALHAETLVEAEARGVAPAFEAMLQWNADRLRSRIPSALESLRARLDSNEVESLSGTLRGHLAASVAGDADAADTVFNLEGLRTELREVQDDLQTQVEYDPRIRPLDIATAAEREGELIEAERFSKQRLAFSGFRSGYGEEVMVRTLSSVPIGPPLPMQRRPDFLQSLWSFHFLDLALRRADDPDEHAVLVELTRVTRPDRDGRFAAAQPGLLEWLVEGYTGGGRGTVDSFVADAGFEQAGAELSGCLGGKVDRLVLRFVGPSVATFYEGEEGSHVRRGLTGGSEVVRVRVRRGGTQRPADHVRAQARAREDFIHALEHADPAQVDNPDAVLPIIRRYRFDPPRSHEIAPIDVEDYPLGHAMSTRARSLAEVLPVLWLLRLGTLPGAGGAGGDE